MLKPFPAHSSVNLRGQRVETFSQFLYLVHRAGLEGAFRLHFGRNIDEPYRQACRDFSPASVRKAFMVGSPVEMPRILKLSIGRSPRSWVPRSLVLPFANT